MVDGEKERIEAALKWRAVMSDPPVSSADRLAFDAWLKADPTHATAYENAERFWTGLQPLQQAKLDQSFFIPSWREHVQSTLFGTWQQLQNSGPAPAMAAGGAVAALLLVLVFLPWSNPTVPPAETTIASEIGEVRNVTLEDGSLVTLGAQSKINIRFDENMRTVELMAGDAYFDVEKDAARPFLVIAGDMQAKVLGTAFDVQLGRGESRVAVSEGLVNVTYPTMPKGERVIGEGDAASRQTRVLSSRRLEAGQQVAATRDEGLGAVSTINSESIGAWRRSRLVYFDAPLSELVADANRYSERPIVIADEPLEDLMVSATFDSSDIDGMLETLTDVFPLDVDSKIGESIVIRARD